MLISITISAAIIALLLFIIFRILWRNLLQVLSLAAISTFAFGWWHKGDIVNLYTLVAVVLFALAIFVKWIRRPRPMTSERLYSIVAPSVELATESDVALLRSICDDTLLDLNFKDHWNACEYNPGKHTSLAQAERIREFGYTGKIPKNMRAASALIEVLTIIKRYNVEKAHNAKKCGD